MSARTYNLSQNFVERVHEEVPPIKSEEHVCLWSDIVSHQHIQAPISAQGVIGLSEVKEYLIEDLIPHLRQLLEKIGFKGGYISHPACPEPMDYIMEFHCHPDLMV